MSLFKRNNQPEATPNNGGMLAIMALATIHDGVIITDKNGVIRLINQAAIIMTDCKSSENAVGFDYDILVKIESKEGREFS